MIWPPTRDMGGVLTLSWAPSLQEYQYCGFKFLIPFAGRAVIDQGLVGQNNVNLIGNGDKGTNVCAWAEPSLVGFWLGDELVQGNKCAGHKCTVPEIKNMYDAMKRLSSKPVGSIWADSDYLWSNYVSAVNYLDFAVIDIYPYKSSDPNPPNHQSALDRMNRLLGRIRDKVTVPVIILAQAIDLPNYRLAAPGIEGVRRQHDFWYNAGFPVGWYSFTSIGTQDIQRTFQDLMHEWYAEGELPVYTCPYCGATFSSQAELNAHIASEHPVPEKYIIIDGQRIIKPEKLIEDPDYDRSGSGFDYYYNAAVKYGVEWTEGRYLILFQGEEVWKPIGYRDYQLPTATEAYKRRLKEIDPSYNFVWGIWKGKKYWIKKKSVVDQAVSQNITLEAKPPGIVSFTSNAVTPYPTMSTSIPPFPSELIYEELEVITTETTLHTCNAKISYRVSSYPENNDPLSCPHCGLSLGVIGIKGSEETIEEPEIITPHIVICPKCGSKLELSISSFANKNIQQYCPVCGESAD